MTFIWATRGHSWGFTFLTTAGVPNPLAVYEAAMSGLEGAREGCVRVGDSVALKLIDPEGRTDRAGRPIPHGFVLFGDLAEQVDSVQAGLQHVWPQVAAVYAGVWDSPKPPAAFD